jgi:hypothetical protein
VPEATPPPHYAPRQQHAIIPAYLYRLRGIRKGPNDVPDTVLMTESTAANSPSSILDRRLSVAPMMDWTHDQKIERNNNKIEFIAFTVVQIWCKADSRMMGFLTRPGDCS